MEELIEQAMLHVEFIGDHVKQGHFDLLSPDGSVILPSVWEQFVEPGWFVTMRMWKDVDEAKKKKQEAAKRKEIETAKLEAEELRKRKLGKDKAPIRFKDAVGRKFTFPFHLCQTWPVSATSDPARQWTMTHILLGHGRVDQTGLSSCGRHRSSRTGWALRPAGTGWRNHSPTDLGQGH